MRRNSRTTRDNKMTSPLRASASLATGGGAAVSHHCSLGAPTSNSQYESPFVCHFTSRLSQRGRTNPNKSQHLGTPSATDELIPVHSSRRFSGNYTSGTLSAIDDAQKQSSQLNTFGRPQDWCNQLCFSALRTTNWTKY